MSERAQREKRLKALKQRKGGVHDSEEEDEDYRIYDELSNDEFRKVTRERLMEDDFVVDDGGEGYVENGGYEWDGQHNYYSDEEEPIKKKQKTNEKASKNDGNIKQLFRSAPAKPKAKSATQGGDVNIDDLLGGFTGPAASTDKKRKLAPRKRETYSPPPKIEPIVQEELKKEPSPVPEKMEVDSEPPSSPVLHREDKEVKEESEDDEDLAVKPLSGSVATKQVNVSGVKTREAKVQSSPVKEDTSSWLKVGENVATASLINETEVSATQFDEIADEEGFQMFWTDYEEHYGQLFLHGKAKSKTEDKYTSCMLHLTDLFKTCHVLVGKDEEGEDQEVEDVSNDLLEILNKHGVKTSFLKPEKMKYCFELEDVPRGEHQYVKMLIPFSARVDWEQQKRDTFTHVFGANKNPFEEFALALKVMGPCWLDIKNPKELVNASWSKITAQVSLGKGFDMSDSISVLATQPPPPPLTVMSLSIRTIKNKQNQQEVLAISGRVYKNMDHDTTQPAKDIESVLFTEVRPMEQLFPSGFDNKQAQAKHITTHKSEKSLLNKFVAMMQKFDPDVIIGHELVNLHLSVILHRLKANKTDFWDKMGRRRQKQFPQGFGSGAYEYQAIRQIVSGRLLCDLTNDMGKSMTTKCTDWSLTEMCSLYLDEKRVDVDINAAANSWNKDAEGFYRFLAHNEVDAYYTAALAFQVQILALSKQLTNLAGNSWAKTLNGSRVDRNEFILLHEFTNQGYIVPEKGHSKKRGETKEKFTGGMVLEPEKGLHKDIVLVLDFNSLYPSVIQEYNICFTTIDRSNCKSKEDPPPEPPAKDVPMGIFPQLVRNLVVRRREVKKLMKNHGATQTELAQWDIKQQALKLTANSMYGCLGFQGSRFYALPLAMLTTFRGREALKNTQELADENSLRIVYGDTDSVMINTNQSSYKEALKVGEEFKRVINQNYRYLEIDIDNVFQCILLQAKKKYAAKVIIEQRDGSLDTKMEVKGLDMRRREFSQISKDASQTILEAIMGYADFETAQEEIFDYTEKLAADMRGGQIPLPKFIIKTRLGKEPESYGEQTGNMPAVRMAQRRKKNGEFVKAGDVMQFIICQGGGDGEGGSVGDRAFTISEVKRQQLQVDAEYYLTHQILPPLERLFANVDGADLPRLAQSMGLDIKKYHTRSEESNSSSRDIQPLESTIPDSERFANATRLSIKCSCGELFEFEGVNETSVSAHGIKCAGCNNQVTMTRVNAQLDAMIRKQIALYYAGWLVCDDPSCGTRTRQVNVYGKKCTQQDGDCRGVMHWEYSDKVLYNQLLYLDSLFDMDRLKANSDPAQVHLKALAEQNRQRFSVPRRVINKYLSDCGRRYVDMHNIFSFM